MKNNILLLNVFSMPVEDEAFAFCVMWYLYNKRRTHKIWDGPWK